jgi:hypothetical protein
MLGARHSTLEGEDQYGRARMTMDELFAPCRVKAHQDAMMLVREAPADQDVQISFIKASLEGTMAARASNSRRGSGLRGCPAARRPSSLPLTDTPITGRGRLRATLSLAPSGTGIHSLLPL